MSTEPTSMPPAHTRAAELATKDDSSVAGGFFTVTVRPWQVMFQAGRY